MEKLRLSIVIPVYHGANTISDLVEKTCKDLSEHDLEIILVNDGSTDNSAEVCKKLANDNQVVSFIDLRKNFGEHNAVMCGLNYITGDVAVIIDDDFQNPPKEIIKLLETYQEGYDVVYSKYAKKEHHWFRNMGSKLNDLIATILLEKPKDLYLSSFKLISKEIVDEIIKYQGPSPYIDGLILRTTRNIGVKEVEHHSSIKTASTYTLRKLISLHLNVFVNFSIMPLRICSMIGFLAFFLGLLLSLVFIIEKLVDPNLPLGWASLITSLFMLSGVQLLSIGMLGEYLGKLYLNQNKTPQWVIKETYLNKHHN